MLFDRIDRAKYHLSSSQFAELNARISQGIAQAKIEYYRPLGTFELSFPQDLPRDPHIVSNLYSIQTAKGSTFSGGHYAEAFKWPRYSDYFKMEYNCDFLESVPERLGIRSVMMPMHRLRNTFQGDLSRGEYRFPYRYKLEGDDPQVLSGEVARETLYSKPCVFCYAHTYADNCTRYLSPAARHARIRNINYTMWLIGLPQFCLGCLTRDCNHEKADDCMKLQNCSTCHTPGHHTALCTTATHLIKKATPVVPKAERRVKAVPDVAIMEKYIMDDMAVREKERIKIDKAEKERKDQISNSFLDDIGYHSATDNENESDSSQSDAESDVQSADEDRRSLTPCLSEEYIYNHDEALILERYDSDPNMMAPGYENTFKTTSEYIKCNDQPMYDLHIDHPVYVLHGEMVAGLDFPVDSDIAKAAFYNNFCQYLSRFKKLLDCSGKKCGSGKKAAYFCQCGKFGLCPPCMFGTFNLEISNCKKVKKRRKCTNCKLVLPTPHISGVSSCQNYLNIVQSVLDLMESVKYALAEWSTHPSSPESIVLYKENVERVVHLMRKQLFCSVCACYMDARSTMILKSGCKCGYLICRRCAFMKGQFGFIGQTSRNHRLRCSGSLSGVNVYCSKCKTDVKLFGVCTGLTMFSMLGRLLLGVPEMDFDGTLTELFIIAMRCMGYDVTDDGRAVLDEEPGLLSHQTCQREITAGLVNEKFPLAVENWEDNTPSHQITQLVPTSALERYEKESRVHIGEQMRRMDEQMLTQSTPPPVGYWQNVGIEPVQKQIRQREDMVSQPTLPVEYANENVGIEPAQEHIRQSEDMVSQPTLPVEYANENVGIEPVQEHIRQSEDMVSQPTLPVEYANENFDHGASDNEIENVEEDVEHTVTPLSDIVIEEEPFNRDVVPDDQNVINERFVGRDGMYGTLGYIFQVFQEYYADGSTASSLTELPQQIKAKNVLQWIQSLRKFMIEGVVSEYIVERTTGDTSHPNSEQLSQPINIKCSVSAKETATALTPAQRLRMAVLPKGLPGDFKKNEPKKDTFTSNSAEPLVPSVNEQDNEPQMTIPNVVEDVDHTANDEMRSDTPWLRTASRLSLRRKKSSSVAARFRIVDDMTNSEKHENEKKPLGSKTHSSMQSSSPTRTTSQPSISNLSTEEVDGEVKRRMTRNWMARSSLLDYSSPISYD